MTANRETSWNDVRRQLFQVLDTRPHEAESVVRAVPLAFPIVEATYCLHERVPEKIGLIRRYLLEAICRFGPCSSAQLDEMLGLGDDIITSTLEEIEPFTPGLVADGNMFAANDEVAKLLANGQFTRIVTHRRTFLVNGLTDTLLPISFWKAHADWRLFPNAGNPEGSVRRASGQPTPITVKIIDRGATGVAALRRLIESGNAGLREEYGVPAGSCEPPSAPELIQSSWVLGFLLLKADGSCEAYSACRRPVSLLDGATVARDYLATVCQRLKPWTLDTANQASVEDEWCRDMPEGVEAGRGRCSGEIAVRLPFPERILHLEDIDRGEEEAATRRLRQGLLHARLWDAYTCSVLRIVPGDAATAARTALVRGVYALRAALRPLSFRPDASPPFDLARWWGEWQDHFALQLPTQCILPRLPVAALLECADSINDTEFLEKLEWVPGDLMREDDNG